MTEKAPGAVEMVDPIRLAEKVVHIHVPPNS